MCACVRKGRWKGQGGSEEGGGSMLTKSSLKFSSPFVLFTLIPTGELSFIKSHL